MPKRRVFISYHHHGDQDAVDYFSRQFADQYDVFTDASLERAANSDNTEYLNQVCREAIDGTSVTIVMLGLRTGKRKFVDWEARYTLHRCHGLLGIIRPGLDPTRVSVPPRLHDNIQSGYSRWYHYPNSARDLLNMIEVAYGADRNLIRNSREMMSRNLG